MSQLSPNVEKVVDVIKVLNGGIDFYKDGIEQLSNDHIRVIFQRMIDEKQQAVKALQSCLGSRKYSESLSNWSVDIRSMYTRVLGAMRSDKTHAYVSQLEEVEDKVLETIDGALDAQQPTECATELRRIRTRMQQCHDEMKSLQEATA